MLIQSLARLLNGSLMVALPLILGFWIVRRWKVSWRFFAIGMAAMVLAQMGHIPFNMLLTALFRQDILPSPPREWSLLFNAVTLGLSAGLWEEAFRYIAYRWMAKDARSYARGLMLGAGHGGIEAIVLGLLVLVTLAQMVAMRSTDTTALLQAQNLSQDQIELALKQVDQFWSTPLYLTLMGAVERVFALSLHLAASVMVLQVVLGRGRRWFGLAVLWHAVLDFTAVALQPKGILVIEAVMAIYSFINLGILFYLYRRTPGEPVEETPPPLDTLPAPAIAAPEETENNLDLTRYT